MTKVDAPAHYMRVSSAGGEVEKMIQSSLDCNARWSNTFFGPKLGLSFSPESTLLNKLADTHRVHELREKKEDTSKIELLFKKDSYHLNMR